jgi:hypothetical protein
MIYAYKKGGLRPPVPPEQAAAEINRILVLCKGNEKDLPGMIVVEAKKKSSPFHTTIYRDSPKDCERLWRTHIARHLILSVVVIEENDKGEEITAPAFPNIAATDNRTRSYEAIEDAIASDEMREELLNDVKQRLIMIRTKYRFLQELAVVWDAIDRAAS